MTSSQTANGSEVVHILVLHKAHLQHLVGTKARYNISKVTIFELKPPSGGILGQLASDGCMQLNKLITVEELTCYTQKIVKTPSNCDYLYMITPFSLYLLRYEKNRIANIMTSSAGKIIKQHFSEDPHK